MIWCGLGWLWIGYGMDEVMDGWMMIGIGIMIIYYYTKT